MQLATSRLSQEDFHKLKHDSSSQARIGVASKIGSHLEVTRRDSSEYEILCDIALYLQKDTEKSVRLSLAQSVQSCENAPNQLVLLLAMDDDDEVAVPILKYSPVISDQDLVHLIPKINSSLRLVAVAERKFLSVTVSCALAELQIEPVAVALLSNETAIMDNSVILQIAQRHARSKDILNQMIKRMPVPTVALGHMVRMQQADEQENTAPTEVKSFTSLEPRVIQSDVLDLMLLGNAPSDEDCLSVLKSFDERDNVTALLALLAMSIGQEAFFISYMAYNTNLPKERIVAICEERERFAMLLNQSGISPSLYGLTEYMFQGMHYCLSKGKQPLSKDFAMSMIEVLIRAEAQKINFATTIGKPLAKVLKQMFKK